MSASQIDHVEMARRKAMLEDAYRFSAYIPDELRQQLEETLNSEQRELVVQLQILAISFGRKLEAAARTNQIVLQPITDQQGMKPSNLAISLVQRAGEVAQAEQRDSAYQKLVMPGETIKPTNPQEIMIVPAHAMPGKD